MSASSDHSAAGPDGAQICIVGAGSLGLALAAAVARAGNVVTVLARPASADALRTAGAITVSGAAEYTVAVVAGPTSAGQVGVVEQGEALPAADALLFTCKGQDLPGCVEQVPTSWLGPGLEGAFVAGFQNGVVKDEVLEERFGRAAVVGAATLIGSRRTSPVAVQISGLGTTFFGELDASTSSRTERMAATLAQSGLPCTVVPDIKALLWTKFCHAIGIFGISALTGLPSAEIFARLPLALAYRSLLQEAAAVAGAEGALVQDFADLPIGTYLQGRAPAVAAGMVRKSRPPSDRPPGYSSMAQDIAAGRSTELEQTFGDILRRAQGHGLSTPLSELVYRLVAGIEGRQEPEPGPPTAAIEDRAQTAADV